MSEISGELILLFICLLGSFFFSGFESGVVSVDRHKLIYKFRHGDERAQQIVRLLENVNRLLVTVLVGNNICNIATSVLIASVGYTLAEEQGQALMGFLGLFLTLVLGEYLPKRWMCANPIVRLSPLLGVFKFFHWLFTPLVLFCMFVTRIFLRKSKRLADEDIFVTRERIEVITEYGVEKGTISPFERRVINSMMNLQEERAVNIMLPLQKVISMNERTSIQDCIQLARSHNSFTLPVFSSDRQKCLAICDVFKLIQGKTIVESTSAPLFINADTPADEILPIMRRNRQRMLIVRDKTTHEMLGLIKQGDIIQRIFNKQLTKDSTDRKTQG